MATEFYITGLKETKASLGLLTAKIWEGLPRAMKKAGNKAMIEAKRNCPVETGALKDSIHTRFKKVGSHEFIQSVIAGDPSVIRGTGKWHRSKKYPARRVTPQATTEYAEIVDRYYGTVGRGFLTEVGWRKLELETPREIELLLRKVTLEF